MRHLKSLVAAALLALPLSLLATDSKPNCESPERGPELIACAAARHKAADVRLNSVYKQLRSAMKKQGESAIAESLQMSQRDWLKFQQSHCQLEAAYEGAGGSFVSAKFGDCMAETTADRTRYLEGLLSHFR